MSQKKQHPFTSLRVPSPQDQYVTMGWELGNKCNYSCSYCVPELHGGDQAFPQDYSRFLELAVEFQRKSQKKLAIELVGGEPTLWAQLGAFLDDCKQREILVDLTSNGSRKPEWWVAMASRFNQIGLSYHTEFASQDHFTQVIEGITQVKSFVVYILALPNQVQWAAELAQSWVSRFPRVMVILKPVRKNFGEEFYPYSQEEWEVFRTRSGYYQKDYSLSPEVIETRKWLIDENDLTYRVREIVANGYHRLKGWHCSAGIDNIHVTTDGDIWRATCREGGALVISPLDGGYPVRQ